MGQTHEWWVFTLWDKQTHVPLAMESLIRRQMQVVALALNVDQVPNGCGLPAEGGRCSLHGRER